MSNAAPAPYDSISSQKGKFVMHLMHNAAYLSKTSPIQSVLTTEIQFKAKPTLMPFQDTSLFAFLVFSRFVIA